MRLSWLAAAALLLSGCVSSVRVTSPGAEPFRLLEPSELPAFQDDLPPESLAAAAENSLAYLAQLDQGKSLQFAGMKLTPAEAAEGLRRLLSLYKEARSPEELRRRIGEEFLVFQSLGMDGKGQVVFTAYYEPVLEAGLARGERFRHPLYAKPPDLVEVTAELFNPKLRGERLWGKVENGHLVPYMGREEIDYGEVLKGKGLELAWLENPWDVMTAHIQGSTRLKVEEGRELRARFAGSNGLPFKSPGMALVEMGLFKKEELSAEKVRRYLAEHPELEKPVFLRNPRYTFFELEESSQGPRGTMGEPLTAERSIAVDNRLIPLGLPAYLETPYPQAGDSGEPGPETRAQRFAFCQDTGGAILGPGRVDVFLGHGARAKSMAGRLLHSGRLFMLLPKTAAAPAGR